MNLLYLNYNNYYNRIIKKYDTVQDYMDNCNGVVFGNRDFKPNDGVSTTDIVNWREEDATPDYLVVFNEDNAIVSRWFVIEWARTRGGQYRATLKRDVITDNYEAVVNAPVYVEKGKIKSVSDVAIYNQEEISFNQIKKKEILLKDKTNIAWIVGYFASDTTEKTATVVPYEIQPAGIYDTVEEFYSAINYPENGWQQPTFTSLYTMYFMRPINLVLYKSGIYNWLTNEREISDSSKNTDVEFTGVGMLKKDREAYVETVGDKLSAYTNTLLDNIYSSNSSFVRNKPISYDGMVIKIGNDYKKVRIVTTATTNNAYNGNDFSVVKNGLKTYLENNFDNFQEGEYYIEKHYVDGIYDSLDYTIELDDYEDSTYTATIKTTANGLEDAPYKIFAIPYGRLRVINSLSLGGDFYTLQKDNALRMAIEIAKQMGASIYDVQLLPFCPLREAIKTLHIELLQRDGFIENEDYALIKDTNNHSKGIILFPKRSNFSFNINDLVTQIQMETDVVEAKVQNQCDKYRLCSPNYAASFEFNPVKTGSILSYNIDCTYKPYSPYIHINPVWSRLYGSDFNDTRGLICSGDFSIPLVNDHWIDYQINNKNYLNAFNRQIESVELNNKYAKISSIFNAFTGTATGAVGGAATGGKLGGPTGAIAGAAVGGISSAAGGIADVYIGEKLRNDALDLSKDQFNFSLENIQALPNTLSKVSSFDYNNKIFPILEYYSCTEQEKVIFRNKMKYNGMTIMRIDKLSNFITADESFVKGQLIRLNDISEDYHMAQVIADELFNGLYIQEGEDE